jgi:hypothetical protein
LRLGRQFDFLQSAPRVFVDALDFWDDGLAAEQQVRQYLYLCTGKANTLVPGKHSISETTASPQPFNDFSSTKVLALLVKKYARFLG